MRTPPEATPASAPQFPRENQRALPDPSAVDAAVKAVNERLALQQRAVRVVARADGKGPLIQVIDRETDQVIRQIPSDNVIKLAAWFDENGMLSNGGPAGLAFDETA